MYAYDGVISVSPAITPAEAGRLAMAEPERVSIRQGRVVVGHLELVTEGPEDVTDVRPVYENSESRLDLAGDLELIHSSLTRQGRTYTGYAEEEHSDAGELPVYSRIGVHEGQVITELGAVTVQVAYDIFNN